MSAAERLVRLLRERGLTVTTAESMTGGLIAGAITAVPGASEVLSLGLCTYSNVMKQRFLGVSDQDARRAYRDFRPLRAGDGARRSGTLRRGSRRLRNRFCRRADVEDAAPARTSGRRNGVCRRLVRGTRQGVRLPLFGHARSGPAENRPCGAGDRRRSRGARQGVACGKGYCALCLRCWLWGRTDKSGSECAFPPFHAVPKRRKTGME